MSGYRKRLDVTDSCVIVGGVNRASFVKMYLQNEGGTSYGINFNGGSDRYRSLWEVEKLFGVSVDELLRDVNE